MMENARSRKRSPIPSPINPLTNNEVNAGHSIGENPEPTRAASPKALKATVALKAFIHSVETLRLYSVKIKQAKAKARLAPRA